MIMGAIFIFKKPIRKTVNLAFYEKERRIKFSNRNKMNNDLFFYLLTGTKLKLLQIATKSGILFYFIYKNEIFLR